MPNPMTSPQDLWFFYFQNNIFSGDISPPIFGDIFGKYTYLPCKCDREKVASVMELYSGSINRHCTNPSKPPIPNSLHKMWILWLPPRNSPPLTASLPLYQKGVVWHAMGSPTRTPSNTRCPRIHHVKVP